VYFREKKLLMVWEKEFFIQRKEKDFGFSKKGRKQQGGRWSSIPTILKLQKNAI
jgi:hypothetical protein